MAKRISDAQRVCARPDSSLVGKIIATVLFCILILSFAIWGIGDIFRTTAADRRGAGRQDADLGRAVSHRLSTASSSASAGSTGTTHPRAGPRPRARPAAFCPARDRGRSRRARTGPRPRSLRRRSCARSIMDDPNSRARRASSTRRASSNCCATTASPRRCSCAISARAMARVATRRGVCRRPARSGRRYGKPPSLSPTNAATASLCDLAGRSGGRDPGRRRTSSCRASTMSARPRSGRRNTGRSPR